MSLNKNFLVLCVAGFMLSACSENAKFPELSTTENSSEDMVYEGDLNPSTSSEPEEIIEVDISEDLSSVSVDQEGTVIIAAVNPNPQEEKIVVSTKDETIMAQLDDEPIKIKPILKKRTDDNIKEPIPSRDGSPTSIKLYNVDKDIQVAANTSKPVASEAPRIVASAPATDVKAESLVAPAPKPKKVKHEPAPKPAPQKEIDAATFQPSITYQVETLYFKDGSSSVNSEDMKKIRDIVRLAKQKNGIVYVLGYSSSRTKDTDYVTHKMVNFKTSLARAEAVSDALVKSGLKPNRILSEALSDSRPLYLEVMPEGERLNRRVEIYIGY